MDPDRARELLARERSRVEREIARIKESLPDEELIPWAERTVEEQELYEARA